MKFKMLNAKTQKNQMFFLIIKRQINEYKNLSIIQGTKFHQIRENIFTVNIIDISILKTTYSYLLNSTFILINNKLNRSKFY